MLPSSSNCNLLKSIGFIPDAEPSTSPAPLARPIPLDKPSLRELPSELIDLDKPCVVGQPPLGPVQPLGGEDDPLLYTFELVGGERGEGASIVSYEPAESFELLARQTSVSSCDSFKKVDHPEGPSISTCVCVCVCVCGTCFILVPPSIRHTAG